MGADHPFYPAKGPGPSSGWTNCLIFLVVFVVLVVVLALFIVKPS